MQKDRLVLLSVVKYLKAELLASGWSNVTFVSQFPDNDNKVVMSGSGDDEVVIPALTIVPQDTFILGYAGIGDTTIKSRGYYAIFLYAVSMGQELDLGSFLCDSLYKGEINMYPFTSGYPGSPEASIGPIYVESASHSPSYLPHHPNVALRYGGVVEFTTLIYT